jgi:hypothetical protein
VFTKANTKLAIAAFSALISACAALPPDYLAPLPGELSQREKMEKQAPLSHRTPHAVITLATTTRFQD